MKLMKMLVLATLIATGSMTVAAPMTAGPKPAVVTVGHVKAVNALLAAMKVEKMMRTTIALSRFPNEEARKLTYAKVDKMPPAQLYERLAYPLAQSVSQETASEMARFYASSYGQKVVYQMYNSSGGLDAPAAPKATAAEIKDMQRPAFLKAQKELAAADTAIQHELFVLMQAISK